jgi:hypothetical protein
LKARVRQQAVLRRLRELGDVTRRGIQRRLAHEFGVSASVICRDVKRLLARTDARPAQAWQVPRRREVRMPEKISLRLSPTLYDDLQQAADRRGMSPSAFIRAAVQQFLSQVTPSGTPSVSPSGDAWELLLARCPPEVQTRVRQTIDRTGLSLADVLKALVMNAVTGAAGTA